MHSNRIHSLQRIVQNDGKNPAWRRTSSWRLRRTLQDLRMETSESSRPVSIRVRPKSEGAGA
jgi:hypothetical protein